MNTKVAEKSYEAMFRDELAETNGFEELAEEAEEIEEVEPTNNEEEE